jgi:Carboxyl transferase domain
MGMTLPTMGERVAESRRRHAEALQMGGEQAVDRHRASGRLPVRERIALLLDEGSWFETGLLAQPERRTGKKVPGDGVVTGFGRQLAGDGPDPVEPPAVVPWDTRSVRADLAAEAVVRGWLVAGDLTRVTVDDGHPAHRLVAAGRTDVSVLFSAGPRVAFRAVRHGPLTGEYPRFTGDGEAMLHLAGVVRVVGGQVAGGRVITDRLGLLRRLTRTSDQAGP